MTNHENATDKIRRMTAERPASALMNLPPALFGGSALARFASQSYQQLAVDQAVGGHSRRAIDGPLTRCRGEASAGLLHDHQRRRPVPRMRARLQHRLGRALGHEHVAPEVAEAPLAPRFGE